MTLLSICIPTYNRASYLEETILSIVTQKRFIETNDVEIVISDNCSTDNTAEIGYKYSSLYGEKVRYYRNSENIRDANFEKVMSYGQGLYLKLNNDTLMHLQGSLDIMVQTIEMNKDSHDVIFFSNGVLKGFINCVCNDLNSFVDRASFWTTWIACFGIWKSDFDRIDDFSKNSELQLTQAEVILQIVSKDRRVYINNTCLFNSVVPKTKGGYNIYQVFVENYFGILRPYLEMKKISFWTLFKEEFKVINSFLIPWTIDIILQPKKYQFSTDGAFRIIFRNLWKHPYLYISIFPLTVLLVFRFFQRSFKQ